MKNIYFIIISIVAIIYVVYEVRKNNFSIQESFWWVVASIGMLLLSIFPHTFDYFAELLNIGYGPSIFFVLCIIFLTFMIFRNSKRIAEQQEKIIEMAQRIALLEEKNDNHKK